MCAKLPRVTTAGSDPARVAIRIPVERTRARACVKNRVHRTDTHTHARAKRCSVALCEQRRRRCGHRPMRFTVSHCVAHLPFVSGAAVPKRRRPADGGDVCRANSAHTKHTIFEICVCVCARADAVASVIAQSVLVL